LPLPTVLKGGDASKNDAPTGSKVFLDCDQAMLDAGNNERLCAEARAIAVAVGQQQRGGASADRRA
jgi:hypothetical protein